MAHAVHARATRLIPIAKRGGSPGTCPCSFTSERTRVQKALGQTESGRHEQAPFHELHHRAAPLRLVNRQHAPDGLAQVDGPGRLRLAGVGEHLAQAAVGRVEHVEHARELAREQGVVLVREEQQLHGALAREHLLDRGVVQPLHHALLLDGAPDLDAVAGAMPQSGTTSPMRWFHFSPSL